MQKIKQNEELKINEGDTGVVYVRLSDKDELGNKNESINNQIELAKLWFAEHKCKIFEIYVDEFKSGGKDEISFEGFKWFRPEFKKMIDTAKKNKFSFVWVKDLDRFSRKLAIQEAVIESLNRLDIKVFSYFNQNENSTMRQIRGALNEDYIRKLRVQARTYHEQCLNNNKIISKPVLGYRIQIKDKKSTGKWILHKKNSEKVIEIYKDFVYNKLTLGELERKYNISKIKRILINKNYLGLFTYYEKEMTLKIPLFLDKALFGKAQERMQQIESQKFNHNKFKKTLL